MFENHLIFVLGMGRSGTSVLTRMLSLSGAALPNALINPNFANPTGYWEPRDALELNDAFLLRYDANWWDPSLRLQSGEVAFSSDVRAAYVAEIRRFLDSCPGGRPLVIKDPRITALIPFWFEAASQSGYHVKNIIAVRQPHDVACSLAARDAAPSELSNLLWLKYNLLAERGTRSTQRVFVDYDQLMLDWHRQAERILQSLSLDQYAPDGDAIDEFLDDSLNHHHSGGVHQSRIPWVDDVLNQICSAAGDGNLDQKTIDAAFDAYRNADYLSRLEVSKLTDSPNPFLWSEAQYALAHSIIERLGKETRTGHHSQ